MSKEFQECSSSKGIKHKLTILHNSEQNGVAERMNIILQESARAMFAHASLPNGWAEAVTTAAYLKNQRVKLHMKCSMRRNRISVIYECLVVLPYISDCERQKLDKKAKKL